MEYQLEKEMFRQLTEQNRTVPSSSVDQVTALGSWTNLPTTALTKAAIPTNKTAEEISCLLLTKLKMLTI